MKARNSKRNGAIFDPALLPTQMDVEFVPFLGMLVHREMIARIGVPDASFFIAKDDVEYCYRARRAGARIELIAASRIEHRAAQHHDFKLPGISFKTLKLDGWRSEEHTSELQSIMRISYAVF